MTKSWIASHQSPQVTVSAGKVGYTLWEPQLKASSSLRAIRGVNVTTELAGMVQAIYFTPGALVEKGAPLVQLNIDTDIAKQQALEATAALAKTVYQREKSLYEIKAISKANLDADAADVKNKVAQVAEQAAIVSKKTIRAPFTGRLGISAINPGQYVNPGDKIVALQTLDPIYVDFYVPQQALNQLQVNQAIKLSVDTYPKESFTGKISTIDSVVDSNTRNVEVEATLANPSYKLNPGMFGTVQVTTGKAQNYLTLPQAAVTFNPYGEVVYKILSKKNQQGVDMLVASSAFVTTGETRGDQIAILKGLNPNDLVVTSGQLKLKNGGQVIINNQVIPANDSAPSVVDE